jgi:hypothetical protein
MPGPFPPSAGAVAAVEAVVCWAASALLKLVVASSIYGGFCAWKPGFGSLPHHCLAARISSCSVSCFLFSFMQCIRAPAHTPHAKVMRMHNTCTMQHPPASTVATTAST